MLNYTDITQNTYIQSWTVTEIFNIEKWGLVWCLCTVLCPWRHTRILSCIPTLSLHAATASLSMEQMLAAGYSGWKSVRNYDTIATGFGGLFDGFMSLTS